MTLDHPFVEDPARPPPDDGGETNWAVTGLVVVLALALWFATFGTLAVHQEQLDREAIEWCHEHNGTVLQPFKASQLSGASVELKRWCELPNGTVVDAYDEVT